jgi:putative NADH-flavin reductase
MRGFCHEYSRYWRNRGCRPSSGSSSACQWTHEVTAIARTPEKRATLERSGARTLWLGLFDATAVRRAVVGHDAVINLATSIPTTSRMLLPGAWRENDRLRRSASANLVDAALATAT